MFGGRDDYQFSSYYITWYSCLQKLHGIHLIKQKKCLFAYKAASWAERLTVFSGVNCAWLECGFWKPLLPCASRLPVRERRCGGGFPCVFITDSHQKEPALLPGQQCGCSLLSPPPGSQGSAFCPVCSSPVVGYCQVSCAASRASMQSVVCLGPDNPMPSQLPASHHWGRHAFGDTVETTVFTSRATWKPVGAWHSKPKILQILPQTQLKNIFVLVQRCQTG